jgi:TatD DNase family protein
MEKAVNFAKKYDNCWATIGIHPADNHAEVFDEERLEAFLKLGQVHTPGGVYGGVYNKIVGVGECGLDYFYFSKTFGENYEQSADALAMADKEKARQKELFTKQIDFALKHDLPLVLHGRPTKNSMDAYRDMLDILESLPPTPGGQGSYNRPPGVGGLRGHAHFFVGNMEIADRFLKLGFLLSFDGPITFTKEYDNVIKNTPIESIMIETDSPYAAPAGHRGQLNYPKYVKEVAQKIADLKNLSLEEVLEKTKNNTIRLFGL